MNILLSGATGFIGTRLVEKLRAAGHQAVVLTRRPEGRSPQSGVTFAAWDGLSARPIIPLLDTAEAVVNLAGENLGGGRWTSARKRRIIESRLRPTGALVEAMAAAGRRPRTFVSASAMGIYGDNGPELITETHPPGRSFMAEVCTAWEQAALQARALGIRVILPRMGLVLGPDGGALQKMVIPFRLFVGGYPGPGTQWVSWIHRDDVAGAMLFCIEHPDLQGPVNLAAPEAVTMKQFVRALGRALHRPVWTAAPSFMLRAALGEMADTVLHSERLVPAVLQRSGYDWLYPDLDSALQNIF